MYSVVPFIAANSIFEYSTGICASCVKYSRGYGGVWGGEGKSIDHMCINPILWIELIHM